MALPQLNSATYELNIPSTGQKVEYRPYLVKEEKILMLAMESGDEKQILKATTGIVEACTFGKVDALKMPMFDLEYIFLKLRSKSVGETSNIQLKCTSCDTYSPSVISLEDIEPTIDSSLDHKVQLTDDVGVIMKWPTVDDIIKNTGNSTNQVDVVFGFLTASIESIYDAENVYPAKDHTKEELIQFLESLSQEQFNTVQKFFEKMPRLEKTVKFDCVGCGEHNDVKVTGLQSFFA